MGRYLCAHGATDPERGREVNYDKFETAVGGPLAAMAFENECLSASHLPNFAKAVRDGGVGTPEYWAWLHDQWVCSQECR